MFWGIILEPKKRYAQTVQQSFHVSMAALDARKTSDTESVQVMVNINGKNYLLCTLDKTNLQANLDLNFEEDSQISFMHNGKGYVHLTGYLIPQDDEFDDMEAGEDEESSQEIEEEEDAKEEVNVGKKRKNKSKDDGSSNKKKKKTLVDVIEEMAEEGSEGDETFDGEVLDGSSDSSESELGIDDDADEDDDDDDDDDEDGDDDEDDDEAESDDEEEAPQLEKPKSKKNKAQNGTVKPEKETKQEKKQKKKEAQQAQQQESSNSPLKKTIQAGVHIEDLNVGSGPVAKPGKLVEVFYVGRLKSNNKQFDAARTSPGFKFRLGKREVIQGWDIGVSGMRVGGKRRITCPPNAAYGAKGSPPVIPPHSTLVFDVELKNVK